MLTRRMSCECGIDHLALIQANVTVTFGCWTWTRATDRDGYGRLDHDGFKWQAHRLAYATLVDAIPEGLTLDHLCRNTACCNPAHLEVVTNAENVRRMQYARTTCGHGHELPDPPQGGGRRRCRECSREYRYVPPALTPDDPRHGTTNGYINLRCRCVACRAANAKKTRAYKRRGEKGASC